MFRFNFLFVLLLSFSCFAQESETATEPVVILPAQNLRQWNVSYLSWSEMLEIDNGIEVVQGSASFYGMALGQSYERLYKGSWGRIGEASLLFGQANAGNSSLGYQTNQKAWYGAQASYRLSYRHSSDVVLSVGPIAIFRPHKWPSENTPYTIKSGNDVNVGAVGDIRLRLARRWEIRQSIGTLAFKASTIWSFGVGYFY